MLIYQRVIVHFLWPLMFHGWNRAQRPVIRINGWKKRPSFGPTAQAGVPSTQFLYVSISFRLFGCQHQLVVRKKCPNHSEILQTAMWMLTKKTLRPVWSNELKWEVWKIHFCTHFKKSYTWWFSLAWQVLGRGAHGTMGCTRRHGTGHLAFKHHLDHLVICPQVSDLYM